MKYTPDFSSRFRILKGGKISLVVSALIAGSTMSFASPTGGQVSSGSATIAQNGSVTTINQSTDKASINWNSFSIAPSETVNFVQPSSQSVTLNRVVGASQSLIEGAMNANGQVFLLNPNGVLFANGSQVNVGGLVASILNITDENFQAGNYVFEGNSQNSIINMGTITANNGYVAMMGKTVQNEGTIVATMGNVQMASGENISLNLNGNSLVKLTIDKGTLNALVENKGLIQADGGQVYLTTQALNTILNGMVNNTGIIEAKTLSDVTGKVVLFAHGGTTNVSGTIDASGGFVETSGDKVKIADDIDLKSKTWLIDPSDFTISASGGDMTGDYVSNFLNTRGNLAILATNGNGDIFINDAISWSSNNYLELNALRNIYINDSITATDASGKVKLYYGQGAVAAGNSADYYILPGKSISLHAGQNLDTKLGSDGSVIQYTVITDLGSAGSTTGTDLQGINGNLAVNYALGADIDATATSSWNTQTGFIPIGGEVYIHMNTHISITASEYAALSPSEQMNYMSNTLQYSGVFSGLGHTISNLTINNTGNGIGLFGITGSNAIVQNIGISSGTISGGYGTGSLVGFNGGTVKNSFSSAYVTSNRGALGGLVGINYGVIDTSYATGDVSSSDTSGNYTMVGGLVGQAQGTIQNSYATGNVSGAQSIGGLLGYAMGARISNVYATGTVTSTDPSTTGELIGTDGGYNNNIIANAYYKDDPSITTTFGTAKSLSELQNQTTFNSLFSSSSQWSIDASVNGGTPYLKYTPKVSSIINLTYNLSDILSGYTYNGSEIGLGTLWNSTSIFGSSYSSWVYGTDYSFIYGGNANTGFTNAGTYSNITIDILKSGYNEASSGNTAGSFVISQRPITVTADSVSKTYGELDPSFTYQITSGNLVGTDSLSGLLSRTLGEAVGIYIIDARSLINSNYLITPISGLLTITNSPTLNNEYINNIATTIVNQTVLPTTSTIFLGSAIRGSTTVQNQIKQALSNERGPGLRFVSMQEAKDILKAPESNEFSVPLHNNPMIQMINGAVKLPDGLSQEFYVIADNTNQDNK